MPGKIGRTSTQRKAILRNQASELLWYGRIETTSGKASILQSYVEKAITVAVKSYTDTKESTKTVKDSKGKEVEVKVIKDGVKKLNARRKLTAMLIDLQEIRGAKEKRAEYKARTSDVKHPLMEKLFNEIAPKYAARAEEKGQGGGYTRIYLNATRKGDAASTSIIELVD